jgi:hypothetical protein
MSTYKELKYNFSGANLTNIPSDPSVTSISPSSYTADELPDNITITGSNFNTSCTVTFIGNDGTRTASPTVTFTSSTSITASVPSSLAGVDNDPYDIEVASSLSGTGNNLFSVDDNPIFATAAGSLGTITDGQRSSYTLSSAAATDPEGVSVTHAVQTGSVPAGLTLNSDGTITGTATAVASDTTSTFTVRATAGSQTSDRQFTITILAPVTTAFTTLGAGSHTPNFTGNMRVLVVAGGGGGNNQGGGHEGGGGGGGVVDVPSYAVTNGVAVPYYVGDHNPGNGNTNAIKGTGENSTWGANDGVAVTNANVITALGGGASNTGDGGSGGGRSHSNGNGGSGIQTNSNTISSDSRTYGFGNNGGNSINPNHANSHPSGGGGGAGGVGGNGQGTTAGNGGAGKDLSSNYGTSHGVSGFFAGGGGGGNHQGGGSSSGQHGGGNGRQGNTGKGNAGTANTGGGAGANALGGSGIIVIKY